MSALVDGVHRLDIELTAGQLAQLDQFGAALRDANRHVNLTRIVEPAEMETRHFLDSLTAALPVLDRLRAGEPICLVDVGSGGGLPGIPLKIAFPALRVALVESVGKKARILRQIVDDLGLQDVEVLADRAETLARDPLYRDHFGWATARALGSLPVVIELTAPFLEPGGLLVAQRRGNLDAELLAAAHAFSALKMWPKVPEVLHVPGLADGRGLVVGQKYAHTPSAYPRRPGLPRHKPL
jgi:16S rRNA (guanine527-N7)-methyltransferase